MDRSRERDRHHGHHHKDKNKDRDRDNYRGKERRDRDRDRDRDGGSRERETSRHWEHERHDSRDRERHDARLDSRGPSGKDSSSRREKEEREGRQSKERKGVSAFGAGASASLVDDLRNAALAKYAVASRHKRHQLDEPALSGGSSKGGSEAGEVSDSRKRKYSPITWDEKESNRRRDGSTSRPRLDNPAEENEEGGPRSRKGGSSRRTQDDAMDAENGREQGEMDPSPARIRNGHGASSPHGRSSPSEHSGGDAPRPTQPGSGTGMSRWATGGNDSGDDSEMEADFERMNNAPLPSTSELSGGESRSKRPAWAAAVAEEEEEEERKRSLAKALDDAAYERELNRKEMEELEQVGSGAESSSSDEDGGEQDKHVMRSRVINMLESCRSIDEFERLNRIDEGAYGVVYRARDKVTNEVLALKKVKMEKEKEGFPLTSIREINVLLSFNHPNIVDVREVAVGKSLDQIFMAMEFMEHDLKGLCEEMRQPFSQAEVKTLMLQLFEGVAYLHDNWVLHRDLKTSNILYNNKGDLKICDFGLARQYGSPLRPYTHMVVTLWYRAPELLLGCKLYSTAVDVWSLGCIMAELLSKEPLLNGRTEIDQLDKMFKLLGTPSEKIWPGFSKLPAVQKVAFPQQKFNNLRTKFPAVSVSGGPTLSDLGFDLLNKLLTYDPEARISAQDALDHPWFEEHPLPKAKEMMPTYPTRKDGTKARDRRKFKSPDPLAELKRQEELQKQMDSGSGGLFSFSSVPVKSEGFKLA